MGRILLVANRLPLTAVRRRDGLRFYASAGGVATGLGTAITDREVVWIGWSGMADDQISPEERDALNRRFAEAGCVVVPLSESLVEGYYAGFSNRTIWPLAHSFPTLVHIDETFWEHYRRANQVFCDRILETWRAGDVVWIHDYQLLLLPRLLRDRQPDAAIAFFLHIPFPPFEVFRSLPWREAVIDGMLGADLVAFHIPSYAEHFLESAARLLRLEPRFGEVVTQGRIVQTRALPMGIDFERFHNASRKTEVRGYLERNRADLGTTRVFVSVDRVDYTKGLLQRLSAFDRLLSNYPETRERVTYFMLAVPSRTQVDRYQMLKRELDQKIGEINGQHGTMGWVPVRYLYREVPFEALVALYRRADVMLVTPLRDGMNLVAKEFVASQSDGDGVLILSETAGAAEELQEAIRVNPNDVAALAQAMHAALVMPPADRAARMARMRARLRRNTVHDWVRENLSGLASAREATESLSSRRLAWPFAGGLRGAYEAADRRLLLLDYDGTLVPFVVRPQDAVPDAALLDLLRTLAADPRNEIVIVSGRDAATLTRWLGALDVGLVAEHGAATRPRGATWRKAPGIGTEWKRAIRPTMDYCAARTPGSFVEEKATALVWHYRAVDPVLARGREHELQDALHALVRPHNLSVVRGDKILEVRPTSINKGDAVHPWLAMSWDFLLAAGDDVTDEDLFLRLPASAYTVKVGFARTSARAIVDGPDDLRTLLAELIAP